MDASIVDHTLRRLLGHIHGRLEEAAGIGRGARACAEAGQASTAIGIINDADDALWSAQRLLQAGVTLARLMRPTPTAATGMQNAAETDQDAEAGAVRRPINPPLAKAILKEFVGLASERLDQAVALARAAGVLGEMGTEEDVIEVFLAIEPLLHEAKQCIDVAGMINRLPEA